MITKEQLQQAAREALANWDADLMQSGQADVRQSIIDNPQNFADNNGEVEIPAKWDIWQYLEEISSSLA